MKIRLIRPRGRQDRIWQRYQQCAADCERRQSNRKQGKTRNTIENNELQNTG